MQNEHAPLRWLPQFAFAHEVSEDGQRLTRKLGTPKDLPWAAGEILPKEGQSAWTICVEHAEDEMGDHVIGAVCTQHTFPHMQVVTNSRAGTREKQSELVPTRD